MDVSNDLSIYKLVVLKSCIYANLLTFILFFWAFMGCTQEQNSPSETDHLSVSFEQEIVLGGDEGAHRDALLASPSGIRTDSAGNIYVADRQDLLIKVFDATGDFKRSIGGSGEGPGEFASIESIDINTDDELIVFDGRNSRITRFSDTGEVLSTLARTSESGSEIWPNYSRQIGGGQYLIVRKLRNLPNVEDDTQKILQSNVLHLFDRSLENHIASFGHIDSLMDASSDFVRLYMNVFSAGHFWSVKNGGVWYAPSLYAGRLFKFEGDPDGWNMTMSTEGHIISQQPVSVVDGSEGPVSITVYAGENPGTWSWS